MTLALALGESDALAVVLVDADEEGDALDEAVAAAVALGETDALAAVEEDTLALPVATAVALAEIDALALGEGEGGSTNGSGTSAMATAGGKVLFAQLLRSANVPPSDDEAALALANMLTSRLATRPEPQGSALGQKIVMRTSDVTLTPLASCEAAVEQLVAGARRRRAAAGALATSARRRRRRALAGSLGRSGVVTTVDTPSTVLAKVHCVDVLLEVVRRRKGSAALLAAERLEAHVH